ncbi:hypothetical protein ACQKGC_22630 [Allorhizobium pseudoryzae]|uniref:hypothetical protein n=1 Tax=Allorhizobium pseudoryzae TaxID=379684 RepID=UPI003CFCBB5E
MKSATRWASFPGVIEQFLQQRGAAVLPPRELEAIGHYPPGLVAKSSNFYVMTDTRLEAHR